MFSEGTLNPHYFANPPAFTYLLHFLFAIAYGGGAGVVRHFQRDPAAVYELARIAAAVLGTLALWLLYLVGARLLGRAAGLLAAAIEAVAFLPSFYSHLALNDVPTLAPLTASLLGTAGVLRKGRLSATTCWRGRASGLACATKYTAGIVLVPLLAAAVLRLRGPAADSWKRVLPGALAGGAWRRWRCSCSPTPTRCSTCTPSTPNSCTSRAASAESQGKLGAPREAGVALLPVDLHLGARLGACAGGARRGGAGVAPGERRSAGCSCRRRCCSSRSWACRGATSAAGCCRSSRSRACWRRSPCAMLIGALGGRGPRRALGRRRRAERGAARAGPGPQRALRRADGARRHAQPDAAVDARAHPAQARGSWSSRSRRTSGRTN